VFLEKNFPEKQPVEELAKKALPIAFSMVKFFFE
jgi:hypothetical protein